MIKRFLGFEEMEKRAVAMEEHRMKKKEARSLAKEKVRLGIKFGMPEFSMSEKQLQELQKKERKEQRKQRMKEITKRRVGKVAMEGISRIVELTELKPHKRTRSSKKGLFSREAFTRQTR